LTRAPVVAPAERARRRARRQRVVWVVALIVVLVAAAWVGHLLWDSYFSAGEPAPGGLTP
jgi:type VI protein secretion system component VasF